MSRDSRIALINQIEKQRESTVIVYMTSDRPPIGAQISDDAIRPLYDHILLHSKGPKSAANKIDLLLYSRGGDVSAPWRIISMIREHCERFDVLVPYKAHSAATMICMGADRILMGKKAELSPIDPTLTRATGMDSSMPPQHIGVEEVTSFISFLKDRVGITDQQAIGNLVSKLADQLTPLALGSVYRQHSHIRLVADKLLSSRSDKSDKTKQEEIIATLTERMYSHGHAIGRKEAMELGLPIEIPDNDLEDLIWKLYIEYEDLLQMNNPLDPELDLIAKGEDQVTLTDLPVAVIESAGRFDQHLVNYEIRRKRNIPPNLQIPINLTLGLPPGIDPQGFPAQIQQIMQQTLQQALPQVQQMVQDEIRKQSPVVGFEIRGYGGRWKEKPN